MNKLNLDVYINAIELVELMSKREDGTYWRVNADTDKEHGMNIALYNVDEFIQLARECNAIIAYAEKHEDSALGHCIRANFMYKGCTVNLLVFDWEVDVFKEKMEAKENVESGE